MRCMWAALLSATTSICDSELELFYKPTLYTETERKSN